MTPEQLLEEVAAALSSVTQVPVYVSYDPIPVDARDDLYLVLGLEKLTLEAPFQTDSGLCYVFTAKLTLTLLAPPSTDLAQMLSILYGEVMEGLLSYGCTVDKVTAQAPDVDMRLHKQTMTLEAEMPGVLFAETTEASET